MKGFIEIIDELWYKEIDGTPWSSRRRLCDRKGCATDGALKPLTNKNGGYYYVNINGKGKRWHRVIWKYFHGTIPNNMEIDHLNNIRDDNRIDNLQLVTHNQQMERRKKHKNNTSGCPGVYWNNATKKWRARITINGKQKHLGYFDNKEEAAEVFIKAKLKYHGEDSVRF